MIRVRRSLRLAVAAVRSFGVRWVLFRLRYALELRSGAMRRRSPARSWSAIPLAHWLRDRALAEPAAYLRYRREHGARFFFVPGDRARYAPLLATFDTGDRSAVAAAERVAGGQWTWFGGLEITTSVPPDWHLNPVTGQRAPTDRHWSELPDFAFGDIKAIWEPSRFGVAYALVRAYWRAGDERYAELFWRLVEDWRAHNPPALGANWKCGQETSFRVMAWCFALYALLDSPASTPERVVMLAAMIAESGKRVEANVEYALSQFNNHGISEGMGLFTIGILFPEFEDSARWSRRGREILESLGRELVYDDGAFSQHSVNYHRLMLQDYLWAVRLAELNGAPLSDALRARLLKASELLWQLQDEHSGALPLYGANDGSLILPLSNCEARDYRPVLQSARAVLVRERTFAPGAWDEEALWLAGPDVLTGVAAPPPRHALRADAGGYYTLRRSDGFAFVRSATFRHRPGHADAMHVDLWMAGTNVALDAGTYGYNADVPWAKEFEGTAVHNTVTVDGAEQSDKVSRFLTYPWPVGRVRSGLDAAIATPVGYWEGEHAGYARLDVPVLHRRAVAALGDEAWLVIDGLTSLRAHDYRLHWLLVDAAHRWDAERGTLDLQWTDGGCHVVMGASVDGARRSLVRADPAGSRGWRAPGYGRREPALSLALDVRAADAWCWTVFSARPVVATRDGDRLTVSGVGWRAVVVVRPRGSDPLATIEFNADTAPQAGTPGEQ